MLPDIDLRLRSLDKALREIVLPALPPEQHMARDQTGLVLAHLAMLGRQWKHALAYERAAFAALCELAAELAGLIDDATLADELRAALDAGADLDREDYDALSAARHTLGLLVDRAISGDHSCAPMDVRVRDAVLRYGRREAARERTWFAGNGLDPDGASLAPITSLFGDDAA